MLIHGQRHQLYSLASELHNKQLAGENPNNNQDEQIIVSDICADIELVFFQFSSIKEVKHLQEDEDIEK